MKNLVPSSEIYEGMGETGQLIYNVPLAKVKELGSIFKIIDNKSKQNIEEDNRNVHERKALIILK